MKSVALVVLIAFSTLVFMQACSKGASGGNDNPDHQIDVNDTTYPVVTVTKPVSNQVFGSGNTISIEGSVTDNGLYQGAIKITDDASSAVVKQQLYEIHGQQGYNFSLSHSISVASTRDYTVSVEFEDHGLNKTIKTVKIKVNP